mgnify:CR=1 FL=1
MNRDLAEMLKSVYYIISFSMILCDNLSKDTQGSVTL